MKWQARPFDIKEWDRIIAIMKSLIIIIIIIIIMIITTSDLTF